MLQFFRSLLQPAPTSTWDPYRWQRDDRDGIEKIVSGVGLALGLIAGFLVVVLTIAGVSRVSPGSFAYGRSGPLVSWGMVFLSAVILFLTANRWAFIGPGFFCVPGLYKSFGILVFGPDSSSISYHGITRTQAGGVFLFCILVVGLTWRFSRNHPAPTKFLDRLALTFFVLATLKQTVSPFTWPPLPLISGLSALLIAWCVYRWQLAGSNQKDHQGETSTFETPSES